MYSQACPQEGQGGQTGGSELYLPAQLLFPGVQIKVCGLKDTHVPLQMSHSFLERQQLFLLCREEEGKRQSHKQSYKFTGVFSWTLT